jgi:hypothetical protein
MSASLGSGKTPPLVNFTNIQGQLLLQFSCAKKYEVSQTYEKAASKLLVKLTPGHQLY